MPWNPHAPQDALNAAALVFIDVLGHGAYVTWLQQEMSRVQVRLDLHLGLARRTAQPRVSAEAKPAMDMDRVAEVLSFYADHTHYSAPRPGARSEVMQDKGERAREVLESLGGENGGGGDAE